VRSLRYTVTVLFQRSNNEVLVSFTDAFVSAFLEDAEDLAESIFADFVLFFEELNTVSSISFLSIYFWLLPYYYCNKNKGKSPETGRNLKMF